jgi:hypothetical protein
MKPLHAPRPNYDPRPKTTVPTQEVKNNVSIPNTTTQLGGHKSLYLTNAAVTSFIALQNPVFRVHESPPS